MTNLMAHTDTKRASEASVMAVVEPDFTDTWHPISHAKVITALDNSIGKMGIETRQREYSMSADGLKMFGVWDLDTGDDDGCYSLGVRNGMDKSMAVGMTAGNKVFVCDNMCFSGDYIAFRKHTSGLNMDELIWMADKALEITMKKMADFTSWHRGLKDLAITQDEMKCLTFDMMKKGVFAPSKFKEFGDCVREEYELSKECNLYTIHGGATRLMRPWSLLRVGDASRKLNGVCEDFISAKAA